MVEIKQKVLVQVLNFKTPHIFREATQSSNAFLLFDIPSIVRLMLSFTELMCFEKATTSQVFWGFFFTHVTFTYLNQGLRAPTLHHHYWTDLQLRHATGSKPKFLVLTIVLGA